jgi:hypothetical protein
VSRSEDDASTEAIDQPGRQDNYNPVERVVADCRPWQLVGTRAERTAYVVLDRPIHRAERLIDKERQQRRRHDDELTYAHASEHVDLQNRSRLRDDGHYQLPPNTGITMYRRSILDGQ